MEEITSTVSWVNSVVWGVPMLVLILGVGIFLTFGLKLLTIIKIPFGFKLLWMGRIPGDAAGEMSPFNALMTSLAATIGTGNIAGVATAIFLGGPGAIFWMWMTALVGMATKYAEAVLAVRFREQDERGKFVGGPMYYIERGMGKKWKWLAVVFACGALFAAFVTGNMIQANAVASAVNSATTDLGIFGGKGVPTYVSGLILAVATFVVIIGGIKGIGRVAAKLIPAMAIIYIIFALFIIIANYKAVPGAFGDIFSYAWNGKAATGGFVGAMVIAAIRAGVARGLFSNEAGQGSAAMAHAAASTKDPVKQARIAMLGTVIDTLIICTMTALVILTLSGLEFTTIAAIGDGTYAGFSQNSQTLSLPIYNGVPLDKNVVTTLTSIAFSEALPGGAWIIAVAMIVFSFTTILGWSYYGERALGYLTGTTNFMVYRVLWCSAAFVGALMQIDFIWRLGDVASAAMTAPNLVALLALSGVVVKLSKDYEKNAKTLPTK